jgi:hypothetical protein
MLPVGIAIMIASVAVGVIALTLVAVMSPAARSAGRRTRVAMALSDGEKGAVAANRPGEGAAYQPRDASHRPTEADPPYEPTEAYAPYQPTEAYAPYEPTEADAPYEPTETDAPYHPTGGNAPPAVEEDAQYYPAEEDATFYPPEQDVRNYPAEHAPAAYATEPEDAPRWVLVMVTISGVGLVLGLLMVMIGSIP